MERMAEPPLETREAIEAHADYYNQLLDTISALEYAGPALRQHKSYLSDLEARLAASDTEIEELAKKTKKERKEHERIRDSTARRLAAKLTGKKGQFEAKESKEEREYVEALQNEMVERDNRGMIEQLLNEALAEKEDLEQKTAKHDAVKEELDSLYSRIFDGPSQSFPEEDKLEYNVLETQRRYDQLQQSLNVESQAAELLSRACALMNRCQESMREALSYSRYDIMGGGSMADYMERNALTNAEAYAAQAESLVNQAVRVCPRVQPVGRVNIATGSWMSDVFFDNLFTDMAFHNKIKASASQVLLANNRLKAEREGAVRRRDAAGNSLMTSGRQLETLRQELLSLRKAIFESIVTQVPKPPSYENVIAAPRPSPQHSPPPVFPSPKPPIEEPASTSTAVVSDEPRPYVSTDSPVSQEGPTSPRPWGSRNPYAAAMAARSDSFSEAP